VIPDATSTITGLQVEGTFRTGTHLVTIDDPISTDAGDLDLAMYGSCLAPPKADMFPPVEESAFEHEKMPGALITVEGPDNALRKGRPRRRLRVTNKGDRAVQVSLFSPILSMGVIAYLLMVDWLTFPFHRDKPLLGF